MSQISLQCSPTPPMKFTLRHLKITHTRIHYFSRAKFILTSHLCLFYQMVLLSESPTNTLYLFIISPSSTTCPIRFISNTLSQQEVFNKYFARRLCKNWAFTQSMGEMAISSMVKETSRKRHNCVRNGWGVNPHNFQNFALKIRK
jgi:hypothetical protein